MKYNFSADLSGEYWDTMLESLWAVGLNAEADTMCFICGV